MTMAKFVILVFGRQQEGKIKRQAEIRLTTSLYWKFSSENSTVLGHFKD